MRARLDMARRQERSILIQKTYELGIWLVVSSATVLRFSGFTQASCHSGMVEN